MKTWAFVQAMVDHDFSEDTPAGSLCVCFRHTTVQAVDETGAYTAGHKWSDAQDPAGVSLLNDYVFQVGVL